MAHIEKRQAKDRVTKDGKVVKGKTSYRALVRVAGYPSVSKTFNRRKAAETWAANTTDELRAGTYFAGAQARRKTLGDMIDRYVESALPKKSESAQTHQKPQLDWWKKQLGKLPLTAVTPAVIAEKRDQLASEVVAGEGDNAKKRSAASVNRYLAALSHVYTIAVREWAWVGESPVRKVGKLREPRGRVRFLSDDEKDNLLKACQSSNNPHLYPLVVVALFTGARQGELLKLRWQDVDFERKRILLLETKNNERRAVPLTTLALELLEERSKVRRIDDDRVFPLTPWQLHWSFSVALKAAGIEGFRFHDLRHTAASYLAMSGATLAEIAEVLGHKTLAMVKRYSHLTEQHTSSVVERMNKKYFGSGDADSGKGTPS